MAEVSLPAWVYDLITAVELYEDAHGTRTEGWPCFDKVLSAVPEQERHTARAIVAWRQESGWLPPDAQLVPVPAAQIDNQTDKASCVCGCPVVEGMCSCPQPCPCDPNCAYCNAPADRSET